MKYQRAIRKWKLPQSGWNKLLFYCLSMFDRSQTRFFKLKHLQQTLSPSFLYEVKKSVIQKIIVKHYETLSSSLLLLISFFKYCKVKCSKFSHNLQLNECTQYCCFKIYFVSFTLIKLMMQKNSSMSSSSYFNQPTFRTSPLDDKRNKRKIPYKVEIINQDLEEAIREVRANVRDNPEWRLNVKAVVSQYPPNKERRPINDSQRLDGLQQQLPISEKLTFPATTEAPQTSFDKLKFTERKRKEFQLRTKQLKQRRMQLQVSLLEKQMKAKLQRKIQQNLRLKEKREMMQDIQQHREESIRLQQAERTRKRMESSLLHQSNIASVKMIRKSRSRSQRQFIKEQKSRSEESALAVHFKEVQLSQSKLQKREIILSRYKNLRCASQGSLNRRSKQNLLNQA